jgi:hypothetical protein|tara:strand:- start:453 stop:638 length:186 start_codon:yes stop_codon:yes gene_type:complete
MTNNPLTATGAPKPLPSSPLWNEWAANNPTPQAKALAGLDIVGHMQPALKGILTGARPVES